MSRFLKASILLATVIVSVLGCQTRTVPVEVTLLLPASYVASEGYAERPPKLTVDGKDEPVKPSEEKKELKVTVNIPEAGKTVSIVYSFWPKQYSNTIRTKSVKLEPGKTYKVDFHPDDPNDQILPIYFPTPPALVREMCKLAKVGKDDIVYDIGCGDGRMVILAVKEFGAKKGVGIDIVEDRIKDSNANAKKDGVTDKVEFRKEDALKIKDLSDATVVLLYVGEDFGARLSPVLQKTLKPGARVVSHRFPLGDWKEDQRIEVNVKNNYDKDEDYVLKIWTIREKDKKKAAVEKDDKEAK